MHGFHGNAVLNGFLLLGGVLCALEPGLGLEGGARLAYFGAGLLALVFVLGVYLPFVTARERVGEVGCCGAFLAVALVVGALRAGEAPPWLRIALPWLAYVAAPLADVGSTLAREARERRSGGARPPEEPPAAPPSESEAARPGERREGLDG